MASRYTETLSPPTPEPKSVASAVAKMRQYMSKADEFNSIVDKAKSKGADITMAADPRSFVSNKMVAEARERSKKGKAGGIPVIGDPLNQNTCAAGVCTIAANAGVSFDKMAGTLHTGLATDEKGRKIPQYNPLFAAQLSKSGYTELKPDEKPMPGDLVQYFEANDTGAMNPYHLEFVTGDKGGGRYETFNNYGLFNEGKGESEVVDARGTNANQRGRVSTMNRFYRLTPEAARAAAGEENSKYIEQANILRNELGSIRQSGLDGESQDTFAVIFGGLKNKQPKEKVLKNALHFAKNKEYVKAVINELYAEGN
jgi:hypothetical protein